MNDQEAFVKALEANEDDVTTRMVYADWLDEHDQPEEADMMRKWPAAKAWLEAFDIGGHGWRDVLSAIESDWDYITEYGSESWRDEFSDIKDEFYRNLEIVTGKVFSDEDGYQKNPFSCSC